MIVEMNNGHEKSFLVYYIILALAAVLVLVWYFTVYQWQKQSGQGTANGPDFVRVRNDLINGYNSSSKKISPAQFNNVQKSLKTNVSSPTKKISETQLQSVENGLKSSPGSGEF